MKQKFLFRSCLLLCSFVSAAAQAAPVKLALNWKPEPQFGGFYTAQEKGYYQAAGFDVEILPGGAGAPVPQLVASGKVDFGVVTGDEIIVGRARGLPLVAIFAVYQTFPQGIMTHAHRKLKSLEDVFTQPGTISLQKGVPYVLYMERKYAGKIKAKIVPYAGGIASFLKEKNFSQQCYVTSEPLAAKKLGADPVSFLIAESGYNPYGTVVVTTVEKLKQDPKAVWAFVAAVKAGWTDYLKDSTATNTAMQKANPSMDAETFRLSADVQKSLIETPDTAQRGLGTMTEARWEQLASQLVEVNVIKSSEKLAAKDYFANPAPKAP